MAGAARDAAAQSGSKESKAENRTLTTKDGVRLAVTYYPSSAGKKAVPVVLIHDMKQSRAVYNNLARRLNEPGPQDAHTPFAVLTVDLRGHGDSVEQSFAGRTRMLEASKLKKADYQAMVFRDMEAVRKMLVSENDAGKLNLNRLSVVGAGLGASVAANWAGVDWSVKNLATVKQSEDIKVLVLVSPRWSLGGLSMKNPLKVPGVQRDVSVMLLYGGKDRKYAKDAVRIYNQLERYHADAAETLSADLPSLVRFGPATELQGADWLKQAGAKAEKVILDFLTQHAAEPDYEYVKRRQE